MISFHQRQAFQCLSEKYKNRPSFSLENDKFRNLRRDELNFEYALLQFNNWHEPNACFLGTLGCEAQNSIVKLYEFIRGHFTLETFLIRSDLMRLQWNHLGINRLLQDRNIKTLNRLNVPRAAIAKMSCLIQRMRGLHRIRQRIRVTNNRHVDIEIKQVLKQLALDTAGRCGAYFDDKAPWNSKWDKYLLYLLAAKGYNQMQQVPLSVLDEILEMFPNEYSREFIIEKSNKWLIFFENQEAILKNK